MRWSALEEVRNAAARVEGYRTAEWILMDYGDFVVHVFADKARKFVRPGASLAKAGRVELPAEFVNDSQFFEKRIVIGIVALSQSMREAVGLAERVAPTDANVLITTASRELEGRSGSFHPFPLTPGGPTLREQ